MGGGNPLKQIIKGATDVVKVGTNGLRAVGVGGVADLVDGGVKTVGDIGTGVIDLANNEKGKQQKKADAANAAADAQNRAAQAAETSRQTAAATAATEAARMSSGSKSRTLLTGPSGLEDGDESITRKTLMGR